MIRKLSAFLLILGTLAIVGVVTRFQHHQNQKANLSRALYHPNRLTASGHESVEQCLRQSEFEVRVDENNNLFIRPEDQPGVLAYLVTKELPAAGDCRWPETGLERPWSPLYGDKTRFLLERMLRGLGASPSLKVKIRRMEGSGLLAWILLQDVVDLSEIRKREADIKRQIFLAGYEGYVPEAMMFEWVDKNSNLFEQWVARQTFPTKSEGPVPKYLVGYGQISGSDKHGWTFLPNAKSLKQYREFYNCGFPDSDRETERKIYSTLGDVLGSEQYLGVFTDHPYHSADGPISHFHVAVSEPGWLQKKEALEEALRGCELSDDQYTLEFCPEN